MTKFPILINLIILSILTSCSNNWCNEAYEIARTNKKDTSIMYLWRFSNNLVKQNGVGTDSGYISYKPNGSYASVISRKYLSNSQVWFTSGDTVFIEHCPDYSPGRYSYKYKIKDDTLLLYYGIGNGNFDSIPITYIPVIKY